jgi:deazaflavin-dependent oxidoreductase (nitroreductase family)
LSAHRRTIVDRVTAASHHDADTTTTDSPATGGPALDGAAPGEEVLDSPTGWVAQHIRSYVDSDGRDGQHWRGMSTLLLTTRGRRSGKLRRTALIYGEHDGRYLVVASNGGSDDHPLWYRNLVADPQVWIQVGPDRLPAVARTADPAEKATLWPIMAAIFPTYEGYQKKSARDIPVVILEPQRS